MRFKLLTTEPPLYMIQYTYSESERRYAALKRKGLDPALVTGSGTTGLDPLACALARRAEARKARVRRASSLALGAVLGAAALGTSPHTLLKQAASSAASKTQKPAPLDLSDLL